MFILYDPGPRKYSCVKTKLMSKILFEIEKDIER